MSALWIVFNVIQPESWTAVTDWQTHSDEMLIFLKQIYLNNSSHCLTKLNTSAVLKSCAVHTWGTRKNKKYFITNMTFHHITLHTINNASFESVNHGIMEWHYKLLWTKRIMGQKRLGTTHIHQKPSMRVHTWS